jgi:hypothetical protein
LSDNKIKLPTSILLKPPLFNYVGLCEFPTSDIIDKIIVMVLGKFVIYDNTRNLLEQEIYKLFVKRCKNIKELSWQTSQPYHYISGSINVLFSTTEFLMC